MANRETTERQLWLMAMWFFSILCIRSGAIWLTGDNRTGAGDGDDEQIVVKLDSMPPQYESIIFVVSIYDGKNKKQSFGNVQNAFIRAVDARGKEMCRCNVSGMRRLIASAP